MRHPYYILPFLKEYRLLQSESPEGIRLKKLISVNIGDPDVLQRLIGQEGGIQESLETDSKTQDSSSFDTIEAFLERFGKNADSTEELSGLSTLSENKEESKEHQLTKLIKEARFDEALKLIESQNLNNPQKSIYFAHQIRFLKKLIAINNFKNKNMG